MPEGAMYIGEWKEDLPCGWGMIKVKEETYYKGFISAGIIASYGTLDNKNYNYSGLLVSDVLGPWGKLKIKGSGNEFIGYLSGFDNY
jgi:hypothetical protein